MLVERLGLQPMSLDRRAAPIDDVGERPPFDATTAICGLTRALALDRVPQAPDSFDLDLDLVAVLQRYGRLPKDAYSGGCACKDEVAWLEPENRGRVRDDRSDSKDELARP